MESDDSTLDTCMVLLPGVPSCVYVFVCARKREGRRVTLYHDILVTYLQWY